MPRKVRSKSNKPKKNKVGVKSNSRRILVESISNSGIRKKSQVYKKGRFRVSVPVSNKTNNNSKLVSNQNLGRTPGKNSIIHKRRQPYKKTLFNNNRPVNNTKNSTKNNSSVKSVKNVKSVNNKQNHCLQKSELTKRQLEIKKHILKLIKDLAGDMTYENRIEMELENTAPFRITPMEITFNPEYKELWEGGDDDIVKAKMKYGFEVTKEEENV